jgi:CO/xanthine dehydrogenase Mo-binding subunit
MNEARPPYVGRSLLRREDQRLLTGQGQFIADLALPRMLHAVVVRSPVAHAHIRAIDLSSAVTAPGVICALDGADLQQLLPSVPEGQISLPQKWTSVVRHRVWDSTAEVRCLVLPNDHPAPKRWPKMNSRRLCPVIR